MSGTILISGATGYPGKLIAKAGRRFERTPHSGQATTMPSGEGASTAKVRPSRRFNGTPMNACLGRKWPLRGFAGNDRSPHHCHH